MKIYGKNTLKIKEIDNYQHTNLLMIDRRLMVKVHYRLKIYRQTIMLMIDRQKIGGTD